MGNFSNERIQASAYLVTIVLVTLFILYMAIGWGAFPATALLGIFFYLFLIPNKPREDAGI